MALTAEEVEKLKELKRTEEFKKNYKLIKDELVKRERQGADMTAKGLILSLRDVLCASCRLSSGSNPAICLDHRPLFYEQK